eukprot:CAMPEP_0117686202 /NCGR_PEP_ID=MMETSP0804-20121206/22284_1 /TAXON_ID=1074897 /ORGANISM="Tetraselmis astigmatica, Strain CCMP880" /LENGTH=262 /DNA_ID=CAMNT_0005497799 /DNA_START=243 /DNA_END=1031 /DNA_ORIENTATION=-
MSLGPGNLSPIEQDIIVSWTALVMITLQEVGLEPPEGGGLADCTNQTITGLKSFVATMLGRASEGMTLQKLLLEHKLLSAEQQSPAAMAMQQNSRIIFLTLSRTQQLATEQLITEFAEGGGERKAPMPAWSGPSCVDSSSIRKVAVRILLAFIGVIFGSPFSLLVFVEEARAAYGQGWSVQEVVDSLKEEEFVQTGGIVPIVAGKDMEAAQKVSSATPSALLPLPTSFHALLQGPLPRGSLTPLPEIFLLSSFLNNSAQFPA